MAEPADRASARRDRLLALWRTMARIRAFEDAAQLASQGGVEAWGLKAAPGQVARVRGPLHLSTGQEAVAAGVCANLHRHDLLTSTHRGHGHTLAKGADPASMMAELFGRASGCNGGKGGSMHIADFGVGMLGANGVVAAGIPIAVGAAQAQKIRGTEAIVACFFGDGAINRGPFLEGLNWARVYRLPVLFVCEDNRISATTDSATMTAGEGASARARSLDIEAVTVDGNDVEAVDAAAACLVDPGAYRDPAEVAAARLAEPLERTRALLQSLGASDAAARIDAQARAEIDRAVAAADAAPAPAVEAAYRDILDCAGDRWF